MLEGTKSTNFWHLTIIRSHVNPPNRPLYIAYYSFHQELLLQLRPGFCQARLGIPTLQTHRPDDNHSFMSDFPRTCQGPRQMAEYQEVVAFGYEASFIEIIRYKCTFVRSAYRCAAGQLVSLQWDRSVWMIQSPTYRFSSLYIRCSLHASRNEALDYSLVYLYPSC